MIAGKNLYAPLAASFVFELCNETLAARCGADLVSIPMSGGETHQLATDEFQENLQLLWKSSYGARQCERVARLARAWIAKCGRMKGRAKGEACNKLATRAGTRTGSAGMGGQAVPGTGGPCWRRAGGRAVLGRAGGPCWGWAGGRARAKGQRPMFPQNLEKAHTWCGTCCGGVCWRGIPSRYFGQVNFQSVAEHLASMPLENETTWRFLEEVYGVSVFEESSPKARQVRIENNVRAINALIDCLNSEKPEDHWLLMTAPDLRTSELRGSLERAYTEASGTRRSAPL